MATEFDDTEELHYVGFYSGTVVDNVDPESLGRVRLKVPSIIEPKSAWAFPIGTLGGGKLKRGWFDVPDINADVGVFFFRGDIDQLFYASGHWGLTRNDGNETPLYESDMSPSDRLKVRGYETPRYQLVFDERDGTERFAVLDKVTGDTVVMDQDKTTIRHSKKVVVDAPKIYLGGDGLNENPISGDGVVLASAIDPFTNKTHGQLAGASTKVFAKKV